MHSHHARGQIGVVTTPGVGGGVHEPYSRRAMSAATAATLPTDPKALIRSRQYRVLLVLAALVGLIVSAASWLFLEAVHEIEIEVYENLPHDLGYDARPALVAAAVAGAGGSADRVRDRAAAGPRRARAGGRAQGRRNAARADRSAGCPARRAGDARPRAGARAGGAVDRARRRASASSRCRSIQRDAPQQALSLMAAAGSFAALASIFGSPVIGAVLVIEAAGLGGAMLLGRAAARPDGRRDRLARVHRPGLVVRVQYGRVVAEPVPAARLRRPGLGRLRLDRRAGRRGRPSPRSR